VLLTQRIQLGFVCALLGRVQARSERDRELLDRARKAVAIGLGLLEEQKHDPIA
jgi:hypothetical protein